MHSIFHLRALVEKVKCAIIIIIQIFFKFNVLLVKIKQTIKRLFIWVYGCKLETCKILKVKRKITKKQKNSMY